MNHNTTSKQEPKPDELVTCPLCRGDGGVNGGCRWCDGSGWVPLAKAKCGAVDSKTTRK